MPSPNVHLEHIEDEIFNNGIEGGRASINFIRSLRDMLVSGSKRSVNVTVKWDGILLSFVVMTQRQVNFLLQRKVYLTKHQNFTHRLQRLMQIYLDNLQKSSAML